MATNWYREGTISVTNNSKIVVGSKTNWLDAGNKPLAGDIIVINNAIYEIESITDNEHLSLFNSYQGRNDNNVKYAVVRNTSINLSSRIAASVSHAINSKQQLINELDDYLTSTKTSVIVHDSLGQPKTLIPIPTLTSTLQTASKGVQGMLALVKQAQAAEQKAEVWANASHGTEVEKGKYSAKHYVEEAKSIKQSIKGVEQAVTNVKNSADVAAQKAAKAAASAKKIETDAAAVLKASKASEASSKSAANDALTNANHADTLVALARKWAEEQPNVSVVTDPNGTKHYSASHWAKVAHSEATTASNSVSDARSIHSAVQTIKTAIDNSQVAITAIDKKVKANLAESNKVSTSIAGQKKDIDLKIAEAKKQITKVSTIASEVKKDKGDVDKLVSAATNSAKPWVKGGSFTPATSAEYPVPAKGAVAIYYIIAGLSKHYIYTHGELKGKSVSNHDLLIGFKTSTGWLWQILASGAGHGVVQVNNKSGSSITLTAQDVGALTENAANKLYRSKSDYSFTSKDIDIGTRKIKSGTNNMLYSSSTQNVVGNINKQTVIHTKLGTNLSILSGNVLKTLATTDDVDHQVANSALKVDGTNKMNGSIIFDPKMSQSKYHSIDLSEGARGGKNLLRKFRGGLGDTIWHETITGNVYRLATGNTDIDEQFRLEGGKAYVAGGEVYTKDNKPTPGDINALPLGGGIINGQLEISSLQESPFKVASKKVGNVAIGFQSAKNAPVPFGMRQDGKFGYGTGLSKILYSTDNIPTAHDLNVFTKDEVNRTFLKMSGGTLRGDGANPKLTIARNDGTGNISMAFQLGHAQKVNFGLTSDGHLAYGTDLDISGHGSKLYSTTNKPTLAELNAQSALVASQKMHIHIVDKLPDNPLSGHVYMVKG